MDSKGIGAGHRPACAQSDTHRGERWALDCTSGHGVKARDGVCTGMPESGGGMRVAFERGWNSGGNGCRVQGRVGNEAEKLSRSGTTVEGGNEMPTSRCVGAACSSDGRQDDFECDEGTTLGEGEQEGET